MSGPSVIPPVGNLRRFLCQNLVKSLSHLLQEWRPSQTIHIPGNVYLTLRGCNYPEGHQWCQGGVTLLGKQRRPQLNRMGKQQLATTWTVCSLAQNKSKALRPSFRFKMSVPKLVPPYPLTPSFRAKGPGLSCRVCGSTGIASSVHQVQS